jgi:hypothetical protein
VTPFPRPPRAPQATNVALRDLGDLPDPANRAGTRSAPCPCCGPIVSRWPMEEID